MLTVKNISAHYTNKEVVTDVCFNLNEGDIACLLGPSGCGKTTLLNALAGFIQPTSGNIALDSNIISTASMVLPPEKRGVGMVFQDYALFPHMTVRKNIGFGVKNKITRKNLVDTLLQQVHLAEYAEKYPHELSGGQQQRVALARSLAARPKLLLLDEPFSNLDNELRNQLGLELRSILKSQNITALLVTHDQQDAFALGDKTGVMNQGRIEQWADAYELYHHPKTEFVANFIGEGAFINGEMTGDREVLTELGQIRGATVTQNIVGEKVKVLIRPDDVVLNSTAALRLKITNKAFRGANILYTLNHNSDEKILSLLPSHEDFEVGDYINVSINADHLVVFPSNTKTT